MVPAHAAQQTNLEPQGAMARAQLAPTPPQFSSSCGERPSPPEPARVHVANHIYIEIAKYEKLARNLFCGPWRAASYHSLLRGHGNAA